MSVPSRTRPAFVDSEKHMLPTRRAASAVATQPGNGHERSRPCRADDTLLQFGPPEVWVVSNRSEPWVQIVAICHDKSAARRLAHEHNAGRHPDDNHRWSYEKHPCNVVALVL